jgi:zinc carboxypeptidase
LRRLSILLGALIIGCSSSGHVENPRARYLTQDLSSVRPLTRAERTNFTETSHYDDVVRFIDSLKTLGAKINLGSIGKTNEGRDIPYVIASRPLIATAIEAKRLNRPIVYVQANIHAGEVEGKEALQALLRTLVTQDRANALDSIVLIAVPIYNADGNERFAPQERNRGEQNGPALVGTRANAQNLDLNRDYVKAEAPETRASLAMFRTWEPDVFVDLHTTDGSYHGYSLTYAPPLNPAAIFSGPYTRDTLLSDLRKTMGEKDGWWVFDYGNFVSQDSAAKGWFTYDARPRFGTNYYGLRGRVSILSEAYSHDSFKRRVASTYDFVNEILSWVAENRDDVLETSLMSDRRITGWGSTPRTSPGIPLRSTLDTRSTPEPVRVEEVVRTNDTTRAEPGMPRGLRRTGRVNLVRMPVYDRFVPTLKRTMPFGYAIPGPARDTLRKLLALHGLELDMIDAPATASAETFMLDSVSRPTRPFQGHLEDTFFGKWSGAADVQLPAGTLVVRAGQPLGVLAMYLLEPETDDGLATWNVLDPFLPAGRGDYPVVRIVQPLRTPLRPLRD